MSIFAIFMSENVYMYQIVFTTTIDTMLFLSVLQKFEQAMNHPYKVGHQKLEHQLIILDHLDEVQARSGTVLIKR